MLRFENVGYRYSDNASPALIDVSFEVTPGCYTALLGSNGSGKSTLAHLSNGLLLPDSGKVYVDGIDSADTRQLWNLRQLVGLVSQDPDEQIISSTVIDEVAFGPENLGIEPTKIKERVDKSLAAVGLTDLAERDPNTLSGGQKQRLVLAGILAMQPRYLVLDEPTSMLDEGACRDFIKIITELREAGHGILHITHDLDLVRDADEAVVVCNGEVVYRGDPDTLLSDETSLENWKLKVPLPESFVSDPTRPAALAGLKNDVLNLYDIRYSYPSYMSEPVDVLTGLNLSMEPGTYTLISGVSGAGKSTLLRTAAGLLKPTSGTVGIIKNAFDHGDKPAAGPAATVPVTPGQVGLVFQHPEDQLFATTVAEDIAFGPRNLRLLPDGRTKRTAADAETETMEKELISWALESVGINVETFYDRSPFMLSGGEMRRVAIAGVLAMQPQWLLFDEPTAGIDAEGRAFIHKLINEQLARGTAVLVVTHSVSEFASRVDRHFRLEGGKLWPS